jgi:peptidoglycan hydrolase CwlO-like protein
MNKDEVVQMISDKEQELRNSMVAQSLVEDEDIKLSRQIIETNLKRKDLQQAITKGKYAIRRIQSELRQLKNEYWAPRD